MVIKLFCFLRNHLACFPSFRSDRHLSIIFAAIKIETYTDRKFSQITKVGIFSTKAKSELEKFNKISLQELFVLDLQKIIVVWYIGMPYHSIFVKNSKGKAASQIEIVTCQNFYNVCKYDINV
jgi:hypothetical protein